MKRLLAFLALALALGTGAEALVAAVIHRHYLREGFPLLFINEIRRGVLEGVALGLLFVLLLTGLESLVRRGLAGRGSAPGGLTLRLIHLGVAGLALAPIYAWIGYGANRTWGLRPGELLTSYGLKKNLTMLALMVVVWLLAGWLLPRWSRSPWSRSPWSRASPSGPGPTESSGKAPAAVLGFIVLLVVGLQVGVMSAFRSRAPGTPETPVLILLVDALRADHLGSYGYGRPTSPAIDSLAADGIRFSQAISPSTFTKTSIASLFTGRYAFQHGVYQGSSRENPETITSDLLGAEETTLAELLQPRGYLTVAWIQNSHLRRFMGFAQGFDAYYDQFGGIRRIHRRVLPWLGGPGRHYGFFAYLHYIDLHDPYEPPPPYDRLFAHGRDAYADIDLSQWGTYLAAVRRGEVKVSAEELTELEGLYDGLIRYIDDEIARLIARLKEVDLYDRSLIVVTADHGDAFGEHGFISHSAAPYDELVRVPLIIKLPGQEHRGGVVDRQVSLVDILPTVAEVVGKELSPKRPLAGCSLMPLIRGEVGERKAACQRAVVEIAEDDAWPTVAIRTEEWKYIDGELRGEELYHLPSDPGERINRLADEPEVAAEFRRQADEILAARKLLKAERLELDERTIQELKALGYVD